MDKLKGSAEFIRKLFHGRIDIGIVLGSGLGDMAEDVEDAVVISYHDIPGFPVSTAPGHKGRLIIGKLEGKTVLCMQGRFHYYEGWSMQEVVYPIRVMRLLGIGDLLLTNAAGCVNTGWEAGDLMIIEDHIKLIADNPLRGPNPDSLGPRFFDMTHAYDKELVRLAEAKATKSAPKDTKTIEYCGLKKPNELIKRISTSCVMSIQPRLLPKLNKVKRSKKGAHKNFQV